MNILEHGFVIIQIRHSILVKGNSVIKNDNNENTDLVGGKHRPGQPNWEYTMWKFQDFSATQILREINFGYFEGPKTAFSTIWAAVNFEFLGTFDIFKC